MVWNTYQNTEDELHECNERKKSLLRQLSEESKAKGSASEQHKTTSKVRNNMISYNFCHSWHCLLVYLILAQPLFFSLSNCLKFVILCTGKANYVIEQCHGNFQLCYFSVHCKFF
ncbi:unnamed protein product [Musa textilis]